MLNLIQFKNLQFDKSFDIIEYIENFSAKDTSDNYITQISIFKKDDFSLRALGDINDVDLKISKLKKIDLANSAIPVSRKHYSNILIQKKRVGHSAEEKKAKLDWLEITFTDANKILISNALKYGFYTIKGKSNLTKFMKKIVADFANKGYKD